MENYLQQVHIFLCDNMLENKKEDLVFVNVSQIWNMGSSNKSRNLKQTEKIASLLA